MKPMSNDIRKRRLVSIVVFALIQALTLVSPYLMGAIIDDYIPGRKTGQIAAGIFFFVLIPFVTILLQTLYNYLTIKYVRKKGNEIALQIMERLVYQEKSYFDRENSLELLSYASKETVGYINFYVAEMSQYYVSIVIAAIVFIILCFLHPALGGLQLLYLPIAYFPVRLIMKNVDREIQAVVAENAKINQVKGDIFQAIEFIKLSRLEQRKLAEVDRKNQSVNGIWGKISALDTLCGIWTSGFATVLFTGLTFGAGAMLILLGERGLQVGQLVSVISYCGIFYAKVNFILRTVVDKKKKENEYKNVFSYLELEGEREKEKGKRPFELAAKIEFRNCTFGYNETEPILQGLNISLEKGKWTGIVGASGSGKSTMFDIIMKLYGVSDGEVYVDGTDINQIDCFSVRGQVTKISQNVFLFPGTLEDNLRLVRPDATQEDIRRALDFACLSDYVSTLPEGIRTDVGEAGKLMSGGEKQRLSIAMGILRDNKVLLLDEVSSNLDPKVEDILAEHFHSLAERGYTIISISHRMEFLKYADVIYEIKKGQATELSRGFAN